MRQPRFRSTALPRLLLASLTLGLLAAPAAQAQTTPVPAQTTPNLGLPGRAAPNQRAPATSQSGSSDSAQSSSDAAPTEAPATEPTDAAETDATAPAAADVAPASTAPDRPLPATGELKVPVLDGERALKTVATVLGEAVIYAPATQNALTRTVQVLEAQGYTG
ncbi:hypothetical protein [Deinococcus multiflagellatus]|uniref:Uncharacterized protein n=1 Tax=Deinococcus multiflagellatus TaxID=1656887 RepID=A0ABW1ZLY6_9DEIO